MRARPYLTSPHLMSSHPTSLFFLSLLTSAAEHRLLVAWEEGAREHAQLIDVAREHEPVTVHLPQEMSKQSGLVADAQAPDWSGAVQLQGGAVRVQCAGVQARSGAVRVQGCTFAAIFVIASAAVVAVSVATCAVGSDASCAIIGLGTCLCSFFYIAFRESVAVAVAVAVTVVSVACDRGGCAESSKARSRGRARNTGRGR